MKYSEPLTMIMVYVFQTCNENASCFFFPFYATVFQHMFISSSFCEIFVEPIFAELQDDFFLQNGTAKAVHLKVWSFHHAYFIFKAVTITNI